MNNPKSIRVPQSIATAIFTSLGVLSFSPAFALTMDKVAHSESMLELEAKVSTYEHLFTDEAVSTFEKQFTEGRIVMDPSVPLSFDDILAIYLVPQYVEARVNNDAEAVTEEIVPELAPVVGLDDISISDQTLLSDTLPSGVTWALACHNSSARWDLNMNDIEVTFPVDSQTLVASIRNNERINTDIDESGFELEFQLQFDYPKNVGGLYCSWGGHDIDIRVNVNVDGIEGEFDVTLENDGSSRVQIDNIEKFEVSVDSVSFDSGFLTGLTNVGISVANLFGASCGSLTNCVNDAVSDNLSNNNSVKNKIKDAINEALDIALTIEGGTNVGTVSLDYAVALEEIETSNSLNRLNTKWDVAFSTQNPETSCTDELSKRLYLGNNNLSTNDDFDVVLPFKTISDLFYTVARQLEPCVNLSWTGMPVGNGLFEIKPSGSFAINSVSDNELSLTLPIKAEATNFLFGNGVINADASLVAEITPSCGSGLEIQVTDVTIDNISGSIVWEIFGVEYEMDAAEFLADAAADAEAELLGYFEDPIAILPSSFGLDEADHYVSIGDVQSNASAIAIGLNATNSDPNCH